MSLKIIMIKTSLKVFHIILLFISKSIRWLVFLNNKFLNYILISVEV